MSTPIIENDPIPLASASPEMPFIAHLEELRKRLIICLVTFAVAALATFSFAPQLVRLLKTVAPGSVLFVQLVPGEFFMATVKLSLISGLGLALPIILYNIIRFVSPGLEPHERRLVLPLLVLSLLLFTTGVFFSFKLMLPVMLAFFITYGHDVARNQWSIASFIDFTTSFLFATGLVFQIPLCLLMLSFIGLLSSKKLISQWKWALVVCFILAAVITPTADPFSQILLAVSLYGLYALSIVLIKVFGR